MKAYEYLQKIPGIRVANVRVVLGVILAIIIGVVFYVLQEDPISSKTSTDAKNGNNTPGTLTMASIDELANTPGNAPVIKAESAGNNSNGTNASQPIGGANGTQVVPPIVPSKPPVDPQLQQLQDQANMKRIKAGFDAPGSKINSGGGLVTGKLNSSTPPVQSQGAINNESGNVVNDSNSPYLGSELIKPKSEYLVQAGTIIPAVMISGLNSDISGTVLAQVRENVYDSISGRHLLIPQGSKLVGQFSNQIAFGQSRLAVAWQRVIYPNGYSWSLKGIPGSDVAGFSGFYDQVDNHYWQIFGASFVMGVITAGMQYSQNSTQSTSQIGGFYNPTIGQTAAGSLGQQLGQTGMMITQKQLNVAPTITVRRGYKFTVMMTADVELKPYKQGI